MPRQLAMLQKRLILISQKQPAPATEKEVETKIQPKKGQRSQHEQEKENIKKVKFVAGTWKKSGIFEIHDS